MCGGGRGDCAVLSGGVMGVAVVGKGRWMLYYAEGDSCNGSMNGFSWGVCMHDRDCCGSGVVIDVVLR